MARMKSEKVQCQFYNQTLYSTFYCGTATVSLHSCDLFWSLFQVCNRSPIVGHNQPKSRIRAESNFSFLLLVPCLTTSVSKTLECAVWQQSLLYNNNTTLCGKEKKKCVLDWRNSPVQRRHSSNIVASYILIHQEHNSWRTSNSKKMYSR